MKKLLALVLMMMLVCAFFSARAEKLEPAEPAAVAARSAADFDGIWGNASMIYQGARYPVSMAGFTSSMEIKEGVVTYLLNENRATWVMTFEQGVLKSGQGADEVKITLHEENIASVTMEGSVFYYERFELVEMAAPTPLQALALAEFDGTWGNSFALNGTTRYPTTAFGVSVSMEIANGVASVNLGGSVAEIPMSLENGVMTVSASESTMTLTLCDGDIISLVMNGGSPIYCERVEK